jgi:galactokinase
LLDFQADDVTLALIAQYAEIHHAGVRCGVMDQMASSLADLGRMLFLDTRSLERRVLPMPRGTDLLVLDSGTSRSLASSGYNQRRAECEAAAQALGVPMLRDVEDIASVDALPDPLRRRARHVVSENRRVQQAVELDDPVAFGVLMNASHASLRDDYEVSVPALDALVASLQAHPSVFGARLTGAGFGGACVALCREGQALAAAGDVLAQHPAARRLVPDG